MYSIMASSHERPDRNGSSDSMGKNGQNRRDSRMQLSIFLMTHYPLKLVIKDIKILMSIDKYIFTTKNVK